MNDEKDKSDQNAHGPDHDVRDAEERISAAKPRSCRQNHSLCTSKHGHWVIYHATQDLESVILTMPYMTVRVISDAALHSQSLLRYQTYKLCICNIVGGTAQWLERWVFVWRTFPDSDSLAYDSHVTTKWVK